MIRSMTRCRTTILVGVVAVLTPTVALTQGNQNEMSEGTSEKVERSKTIEREPDRVGDRRVMERRTETHRDIDRPGELYVAGFGGYTFGHTFSDVEGTGVTEGQPQRSIDLANAAVYGGKIGYFMPGALNWMGLEVEGFSTTPHLGQSALGPGAHLRVTTLAFNVIARGKFACETNRESATTHRTGGAIRTEYERFCPLQPYAGVGFGLFFADMEGGLTGGRSSSDNASPGFNGLAGIRYFMNEHIAVFAEYKYTRTRFNFDNSVAANAGISGDYSVSHVVGGLSLHF